jgi:uncharacterized protein (DUF1800 family)
MQDITADEPTTEVASPTQPWALTALATAASLAACGGGGGETTTDPVAPTPPAPVAYTEAQASRFLAQASMGVTRADIAKVVATNPSAWLEEQFNLPVTDTRWDWLINNGYNSIDKKNGDAGFDAVAWRKLISAPDTLRQRVTLALSEILVVAVEGLVNGGGWRQFAAASYLDTLEAHAFGNLRTLLRAVSTHHAMGLYLTYKGNSKASTTAGTLPDENYARELMQLFTIGLVLLNPDGSPKLVNGAAQETYDLADIAGLARVFTGWGTDLTGTTTDTPDYHKRPMIQTASKYETGAKTFLDQTIAAGLGASEALDQALDVLFQHPNTGPFWSRQLIQRLVTSNPSAAYVNRVSSAFANDGNGVRGNLKAVVTAVLMDTEARSAAGLTNPNFGKLREPILRQTAWARSFNVSSPSGAWAIGNTSDPGTRLGQSPLRSPSVFNFFRPGYVPPNSAVAQANLVAPEFQLANESSVVGYVNWMQRMVSTGVGDVKASYSTLLPLADTADALLAEINLLLAANQLSSATLATVVTAIASMPSGTDTARNNRIYAALTLVLAAPEFLVQK